MNLKSLIPALMAITAMTMPAYATSCIERTVDGGAYVETYVAGQTQGGPDHNGTDYTKATFCPVAAAVGTCTGESLSTFVAGPVYAERLVELPDTDEFAKLDVKATAKAVAKELITAILQHRAPNPVAPIYGGWSEGSCP